MAVGTATSSVPPRRVEHEHELVEYGRYIDQQLSKTARQVRGVDIASGLMCWLAGTLAYLMLAAAADHWLLAGGLGLWGRWLALLGLVAGSGWFLARYVAPLLLHRINPVYSAHTIERGRPQLKNSLVNFLLLRSEPRELPELVRDALQTQAANGLAEAPVEQTLDRTPLIRFALVLLGSVVVAALYIMLSPKDPLRSAARVMFPWASIDRPTRFKIENLQVEVLETGRKFSGGKAEAFYGQRVKISASVMNRGHIASEPLVLRFTTADGAAENQALTLEARERSADIVLPAGTLAAAVGGGLQQSLDYTLTAGDAIAGPFRIDVLAAPSIEIESLEYDYPDYTRLPSRTLRGQGDVSALEGTRVIIRARANQEILQAWLDLNCDGRRDAAMQAKGHEAGVNFIVALAEDRRTPTHASYLLRFKNADGFENPQPIRYQIDVTPDLAPEIAWESPREVDEPRELPVDEALELVFAAGDRDFDLAKVILRAEVETDDAAKRRPWEKVLLSAPRSDRWTSETESFIAGEHGFRAGETILIWGEAADNRQPKPNLAETPKLKLTLLPPRDPAEKQGPNHRPNDGSQEPPPQAGEEQQPSADDAKQDEGQERGQQGKEPSKDDKQPPRDGEKGQRAKEGEEKQQPGANKNQQSTGEPGEPQQGDEQKQPQDAGEKQQGAGEKQPGEKGDQSEEQQGGGESSEGSAGEKGDQQGNGAGNETEQQSGAGESGKGEPSRQGNTSGQKTGQEQGSSEDGGESSQGEPGSEQAARRVDPDSQDGDAFERMRKHFEEQENKEKGSATKQDKNQTAGDGQKSPDEAQKSDTSSDGDQGESSAEQNAAGNESQPEQGAAKRGDQTGAKQSAEEQQGSKSTGEKPDPQEAQEGGAKGEQGENGAQERAGQDQPQGQQQAKESTEQQEPGDNQPSVDNQTSPGAGQKGQEESTATPEAQGDNRQRDKNGKPSESEEEREGKNEPQSPSQSHQHSDSKGAEPGDKSGGGGEGGGQNADQQGTGSAGSNTEADDGSGAAEQSGDGETDGRGGDDRESNGNTGDPNAKQTKGQGKSGQDGKPTPDSQKRPGEAGEQPSGDQAASNDQPAQPSDKSSSSTAEGKGLPNGARQSGPSQQSGQSEPQGGGEGSDDAKQPKPQPPQQEPGGDAANRDFANRATDLVLDRLKDQLKKGQPDEALLDKLQWTKQDLERFVNRWDQMKAAAKQSGATGQKAKAELDQALKSLGLRPRGTKVGAGQSRQDQARGNRDSRRSEPPAEYADQYREFNKGTSKGK